MSADDDVVSVRTENFVADEARLLKRSMSALVEELTKEASRMRRFPGIGFRGPGAVAENRRPLDELRDLNPFLRTAAKRR